MNHLTPQQRKIAYLVALALLTVPIILLGRPAPKAKADRVAGDDAGGVLAAKRDEFTLGEASLGNVDPSSSTMNLVLFGLRGVATNVLWQDAMDAKEKKDWARLRSDVDSITLLQPHYEKVWDFQGWNLAYNVAAEWDNVPDRWYWVKEGTKFVMDGTERNNRSPDLRFKVGQIMGQKIGNADEKSFYRKYFTADPDEAAYGGGTDADFNRSPYEGEGDFRHHHLGAKRWYRYAVEADDDPDFPNQAQMLPELFASKPAESQRLYAESIEEEGEFGDAVAGWRQARTDWVEGLGRRKLPTFTVGPVIVEATDAEVEQFAADATAAYRAAGSDRIVTADEVRSEIARKREALNYDSWKANAELEQRPGVVEARKLVYEGKQAFVSDEPGAQKTAADKLRAGLALWEEALRDSPMRESAQLLEDRLVDLLYLREARRYSTGESDLTPDVPLFDLYDESAGPFRETAEEQMDYELRNNLIRG